MEIFEGSKKIEKNLFGKKILIKVCKCKGKSSGPKSYVFCKDGTVTAGYAELVCDECGMPWIEKYQKR